MAARESARDARRLILQGGPGSRPRPWQETALPLPKTGHVRQVGSREWSGRLPAASTAPATPAAGCRGRRRAPEAALGWSQCHAARAAARRRRAAPQGVAGTFVCTGPSLSAQPQPVFDQKHCRSRPPSISSTANTDAHSAPDAQGLCCGMKWVDISRFARPSVEKWSQSQRMQTTNRARCSTLGGTNVKAVEQW